MNEAGTIKIALVDDHTLMRDGLIRQLSVDPEFEVIMEATHGLDALQQLENSTLFPDIAIIDLSMQVMDGVTLAQELKKKYPQIHTLVLSGYCSDYNVAIMIHNGVSGYLAKDCAPTEFRQAIHQIYEKGVYYSSIATEHTFKSVHGTNFKALNIPEREMEFLKLCCTELRYEQIAEKMNISIKTLEGCRTRLFGRLDIGSRTALILFAMQTGIISAQSLHPNNFKLKS